MPERQEGVAATKDEKYVVSDERLAEIRGLINWNHSGWQTLPSGPHVTKYDLAAAVEDLLTERDERD